MKNSSVIDLPDVNVWVALANPSHAFHASAREYWEALRPEGAAFCRITMLGLLRLITDSRVMNGVPFTRSESWEVYRTFRSLPEIHFLAEPAGLETWFASLEFPQRLWTDAYLAAFALAGKCRIVSFDSDFQQFPGLEFLWLKKN